MVYEYFTKEERVLSGTVNIVNSSFIKVESFCKTS